MKIEKSIGVSPSERLLAELCERSFLKLWSYPNPYKDDGKELCDLLVVFENEVLIFFDRRVEFPTTSGKDTLVLWKRWRRNAVDRQIATAHGAAKYIHSGRPMYLDARKERPFPLSLDITKLKAHKIVIAHGAAEACLNFSADNVSGSLGISYSKDHPVNSDFPFMLNLPKNDPVHVFDSHNLPIVLGELDTIAGFTRYLDAKVDAIQRFDPLTYCGEEDLLAHYLLNLDDKKHHFIGTKDKKVNSISIVEGGWREFAAMPIYANTKTANNDSYLWDELIQRTSQNSLDGTLEGINPLSGRSAIIEMAKEPRFMRRELSRAMSSAVVNFPEDSRTNNSRYVSLWPSIDPKKGYVFLQLHPPEEIRVRTDYRAIRQRILEIACAAAKNLQPELETAVGIAIDSPKFTDADGEDFVLMDCKDWTEETRAEYQHLNSNWGFFQSPSMKKRVVRTSEFVPEASRPRMKRPAKIGRNERCPCGSGRKYKKCHG